RALARRPDALRARMPDGVEVVGGDCLEPQTLPPVFAGVRTAYYLVHSMGTPGDFAERDRVAARAFADAARSAGVKRIVYLGGLGDDRGDAALSDHLRSRQETGEVLRAGGVPVIEFRGSVIIGSGSLSFELLRALTERLPIMICPRWVATPAQPIAIEDVVAYLVAASALPESGSRIYQIGGAERASYGALMREYARQRGLRRLLISVPVLTPRLSSLWLGLITPVYARVGRHLIEGLRNATVVTDESALRAFSVRPLGLAAAVARALANEDREFAETRWCDALSSARGIEPYGGARLGSRLVMSSEREVDAPAEVVDATIMRLGGETGWYGTTWIWKLRGFVDLLFGGPGMRRGRRDPSHVRVGDVVDFWRVEAVEESRLLLRAEMRLPGRAWLELAVTPAGQRSRVRATATFDPRGLAGLAYWYALHPVHRFVFTRLLNGIAARASRPAAP
ncbi:MAG: SDR family oxidoreductase, partial [Chloroflexi bacterium]|nr:SDR family oxidoreductase [Chloroflexota bacterium]